MTHYSFEFFPPATPAGRDNLLAVATELAELGPRFMSVTYGAGGSTQERTVDAVRLLSREVDAPIAAHLTTVNASFAQTDQLLDTYAAADVRHLVALRGDGGASPDEGSTPAEPVEGYRTEAELVAGIRARPDGNRWDISVAAYPEVHPLARSAQADLDNLRAKLDAGADRAITQFFFEPEVFLRFLDRARAAGIEAPIVPGIMVVNSFTAVDRFARRCGADVPRWLTDAFEGLEDDPDVHQCVAATVAAELCGRLKAEGIDDFHFYTMNRRQLTSATVRTLNLTRSPQHGVRIGA
ncbi:MAG: methylenetetrahydrofolate reductase [Actinomycetota bacterium]